MSSVPIDIDRAAALAPDVVAPSLLVRTRRWGPGIATLTVFILCAVNLDVNWDRLFDWSEIATKMLAGLFRPSHAGFLDQMLAALVETAAMGLAGTALAILLAIPLGMLGSKALVSNPILHGVIRLIYDVFRAIPTLIWAAIMIRAFGLGPMVGVMALAVGESVFLAKIFAEYFENANKKPVDAMRAAGASRFQALRYGLAPQVLPTLIGISLYMLEVNMRAAAALGIVGAGGIGQMMQERVAFFAFDQVAFMLILLLAMVACIDFISGRLRRKLVGNQPFTMG